MIFLSRIRSLYILTFLLINYANAFEWEIQINNTIKELPLIRDNGSQTVYDPNTNLIWLDSPITKKVKKDYWDANNYCKELSLLGYKTWRLPTINELASIYDKNNDPHIKSPFQNVGFIINSNYYDLKYWSNTEYHTKGRNRGFEWRYTISYHNRYKIDQDISYSPYTEKKWQTQLYFTCVTDMKKTLNNIISYFIEKQTGQLKKPQKQILQKDEFETTTAYLQRVKHEEKEYKQALFKYEQKKQKIKEKLYKNKNFLKKAIKIALESKWGKPIIKDLKYNADKKEFSANLTFDKNKDFQKQIFLKVPLGIARRFKRIFNTFYIYAVFNVTQEKNLFQEKLKKIVIVPSEETFHNYIIDFSKKNNKQAKKKYKLFNK